MQDTNKQFDPQQGEEIEINLKEYLDVILKRKKLIVMITALLTVIITIYALLQPNIYKSTAVIIPQTSSSGGLSSMISSVAGSLGGLLPSMGSSGDLGTFNNVLNSNDLAGKVVDKLDLLTVFRERDTNIFGFITSFLPSKDKSDLDKAKEQDALIKSLKEDLVGIKKDDKANSITISVSDKDPILAQKIAQQYLIELDNFLNENNLTVAKKNRLFLEDQLNDNKIKLAAAENALKNFQERNNIIAPDKQAELSVTATADIQAQIAIEEMNMNTMKITGYKKSGAMDLGGGLSGSSNKLDKVTDDDIQNSKVKIQQLKKQMNNLTFGESFSPLMKGKTSGVAVPLANAPNLTLEYIRLKREAMVQEKIFEFLTQQYEAAKLSESNESISFIVIDKPKVATKKDKPKRAVLIIFGMMAGLFVGTITAFTMEWYLKQNPNPKFLEANEKDNKIKKFIKGLVQ